MNKEKLKGIWEKIKETLKKVSKKIWILIAVILVAVIVAVVIIINARPYATLISGATAEEASTVTAWLDEQGVTDYKTEGQGTVLVPESQAANLKARLLQEQYNGSNTSFSGYFEHISALSTQTERENAWRVALMDELAGTIRQFEGVRDAKVVIDPGEDRTYILDSSNAVEATAGVVLTMKDGKTPTQEQVNAIRNYIAHSIAGLNVESVSISDTLGNQYGTTGTGGAGDSATSDLKLRLEQEWNNIIRTDIMNQLSKVYGQENVSVVVRCTVELMDTTTEDYQVFLPEYAQDGSTNGAGIIGRRVYGYNVGANDENVAGGLVGTGTNADLPTYVEQEPGVDDVEGRFQGNGEIDYDNPKRQTTSHNTAGYISDCTVSVMINSGEEGIGYVNTEALRSSVANSAGIAAIETETMTAEEYLASKISIMAVPFLEEPEPDPPLDGLMDLLESVGIPGWVVYALIAGLVLFAILLTVILLMRKKKREQEEAEMEAVEEIIAAALPEEGEPQGADVMDLHTERSMELRQNIRDFVDENMEISALLIRSWLKGEDDNA